MITSIWIHIKCFIFIIIFFSNIITPLISTIWTFITNSVMVGVLRATYWTTYNHNINFINSLLSSNYCLYYCFGEAVTYLFNKIKAWAFVGRFI